MNWARQGKAGEKSQKGKEKKGNRQEDNCSRCLHSVSSPKSFFFLFWFFSLHFFLGLDDHDPS